MQTPKSAIITGAASGLGRALAIELGRRGWRLALADLDEEGADVTLDLVRRAGGQGTIEFLDVTRFDSWVAMRDGLLRNWKELDLLVNNAGFGYSGDLGQWTVEEWNRVIAVNLNGAVYGCQAMLEWLKDNPRRSHIVNVASLAAIASPPGLSAYAAAKAGLMAFSEAMYNELKPYRIGVTCVCPAFFRTNMVQNGHYATPEHRAVVERMMQASNTYPEDVAWQVIKAMDRNRLYAIVPGGANITWWLKRLWPTGLLNIVAQDRQRLVEQVRREELADVDAAEMETIVG